MSNQGFNDSKKLIGEKKLLIEFLKDRVRTQEDTLEIFHKNIEQMVSSNEEADGKRNSETKVLSESEALYKAIEVLYKEASAIQKSFGEIVATIMKEKGFTKLWHGNSILDIPRASKLTGLNPGVFRTNMYRPNCVVDMSLIMSMCIGFKLSPVLTERLLQSAGLSFRFDNPEHLAYLFLLEYCRDFSVAECNEILAKLGIPKTKRLGSYGRGKGGESLEYKTKNP